MGIVDSSVMKIFRWFTPTTGVTSVNRIIAGYEAGMSAEGRLSLTFLLGVFTHSSIRSMRPSSVMIILAFSNRNQGISSLRLGLLSAAISVTSRDSPEAERRRRSRHHELSAVQRG